MLEVHRPLDNYAINHVERSGYVLGYESGFDKRYRITTPKGYKVQEGDKLVWLGDTVEQYSQSELTFGKVYDVERQGGRLIYKNDMTTAILARSERNHWWKFWGVIPRYENVKEEEEMNGNDECVGKFKKGDRVRVTGGNYKGWEGSVGQSDEVDGELSCAVLFDDGRGGRWVEEELLELVKKAEKSPEQEAFEYLLSRNEDATRRILQGEVAIWAKIHLEHGDYDNLRQATEILEKLEKGE